MITPISSFRIPADEKQLLEHVAAVRGTTMTDVLCALVRAEAEKIQAA